MTHLLLTVRFLDDRYHGLLDRGGPPEWPPSPFRLFQALVAGVARQRELVVGEDIPSNTNFTDIGRALGWLQQHTRDNPPIIIAPKSKTGQAITRFVPNNDADKKDRQERLTAKHTEPTLFLLEPDQKPEVHYVWDIAGKSDCPLADIERIARSMTTLGWGIDMAFADARPATLMEVGAFNGIRWYPNKNAGTLHDTLRVPTVEFDDKGTVAKCTLSDLRYCHHTFINRVEHGKPLKTVDKPKVFDRIFYTSTERPMGRHCIVFKLLDDDLDTTRYPQALLTHVAAVVRHAAIDCMEQGRNAPSWLLEGERGPWVSRFVRGKKDSEHDSHQQISYVPLPSIGHEHSDAMIRNVMLIAPIGHERELEYVAERLNGVPLEFKDASEEYEADVPPRFTRPSTIQRFTPPKGKFIDRWYLDRSTVWQSVTPVILDEHIDKRTRVTTDGQTTKYRDPEDFERLIKLALQRAGIETPCRFTWQALPFYKNCLTAHRYDRDNRFTFLLPKRLDGRTAVHVRLHFDYPVSGPITLGAGRHCGFGLFAASGGSERGGRKGEASN